MRNKNFGDTCPECGSDDLGAITLILRDPDGYAFDLGCRNCGWTLPRGVSQDMTKPIKRLSLWRALTQWTPPSRWSGCAVCGTDYGATSPPFEVYVRHRLYALSTEHRAGVIAWRRRTHRDPRTGNRI